MHREPICGALLAASLLPIHAADVLNTCSGTDQDGGDGATQGDLVRDRSTTRLGGSRTEVGSTVAGAWAHGVLNDLCLNVRAEGVVRAPAPAN